MNHCLIQAVINSSPQMRYTKDNKTPIAEMTVNFKGLRDEDPSRELKVLGWGNIAQEMVGQLKEGQNIVIEGRLRMNSLTRKDGTKEKQPELTASRIHNISPAGQINSEKKLCDHWKIDYILCRDSGSYAQMNWEEIVYKSDMKLFLVKKPKLKFKNSLIFFNYDDLINQITIKKL